MAALSLGSLTGNGAALAETPPPIHEMHVAVKSITVLDDGDPDAASGCGEISMDLAFAGFFKDLWTAPIDNGRPVLPGSGYAPRQTYCNGAVYFPSLASDDFNKVVVKSRFLNFGDKFTFHIGADELDAPGQMVWAENLYSEGNVAVPGPGEFIDKELRVTGSNEFGTVDLKVVVRVRTFY